MLYDELLSKQVGSLTKRIINRSPSKAPLTYRDINGRVVQFPNLVFPYRRALLWVAKTAYDGAINSGRPHSCALLSNLDEDEWNQTFIDVASSWDSNGFVESQFMMND